LSHFFFVFASLPRPPCSPLLPYTTLFRSALHGTHVPGDGRTRINADREAERYMAQMLAACILFEKLVQRLKVLHHAQRRVTRLRDRKSTRLNSSHVKISYAVFCLKKKQTR